MRFWHETLSYQGIVLLPKIFNSMPNITCVSRPKRSVKLMLGANSKIGRIEKNRLKETKSVLTVWIMARSTA